MPPVDPLLTARAAARHRTLDERERFAAPRLASSTRNIHSSFIPKSNETLSRRGTSND